MGREIFEEAYRHFTQEGRRYEYGRSDMALRNHSPNGRSDTSRTEQDGDGDGMRGVDCSSLVWRGLRNAGYDVGTSPFATSQLFNGKNPTAYARQHFDVISATDAKRPHGPLEEGDIVMFRSGHGQHVGIFRGYDAKGNMQFFGSQVSTGPALVTTGTAPGGYWNGGDFEIVGALRAKSDFQVRKPLHAPSTDQANAGTSSTAPESRTGYEPRDRALQAGASGEDVRRLQADLNRLGYNPAADRALQIDGQFGPETVAAVRRFQEDRHLPVDAIAGVQTFGAIRHDVVHHDSQVRSGGTLVNQSAHPDHELYKQALDAVQKLDAEHQRPSGEHSQNLAAALTDAARRDGLTQIDHVMLSEDKTHTYAVQGDVDSPFKKVAGVDTAQAAATPVKESTAALELRGSSLSEDQQMLKEQQSHFVEVIRERRAEHHAEHEAHQHAPPRQIIER